MSKANKKAIMANCILRIIWLDKQHITSTNQYSILAIKFWGVTHRLRKAALYNTVEQIFTLQ